MLFKVIPKLSLHNEFLQPQAEQGLVALGRDLGLARLRRKEFLRGWALRMGVALPEHDMIALGMDMAMSHERGKKKISPAA